MTKPGIIFFGNERLATGVTTKTPTLLSLIQAGYPINAIVSSFQQPTSRQVRLFEIEQTAHEHNIPLLLPSKLNDIYDQLASYNAQIGILVAYGKIIPQKIIDIFPNGIINLHPSLLPLHRGSTPIESVILSGETTTGMSLMQLVHEMDAGPIYAQSQLKLAGTESKQALADQLLNLGQSMLLDLLPQVIAGTAKASAQTHAKATYDQRITKDASQLDWSKPALQIEREIRAYLGWPGTKAHLFNTEVTITAAHLGDTASMDLGTKSKPAQPFRTQTGEFAVTCATGEIIIDRLKPAGKREMTGREFWAGHHL